MSYLIEQNELGLLKIPVDLYDSLIPKKASHSLICSEVPLVSWNANTADKMMHLRSFIPSEYRCCWYPAIFHRHRTSYVNIILLLT